MVFSWWWLWLIFIFIFLMPSVGYGWGYRRWGPPYPRYIQRRRGDRATATANSGAAPFDHHAWGWGGDLIWIMLIVAFFWLLAALWWR